MDSYWIYCLNGKDNFDGCYYIPDFQNYGGNFDSTSWTTWLSSKKSKKYVKKTYNFINEKYQTYGYIGDNDEIGDLDFETFQSYWNIFLTELNSHCYTSNLYPTRRCWITDYSSSPIEYCTRIDDVAHKGKTQYGENSLFPMQMKDRNMVQSLGQTVYLMGIVIGQIFNCVACKTCERSIFEQGMTNQFMNYSLLFSLFLSFVYVYVPFANTILGTYPLRFEWWFPATIFAMIILILSEIKKSYWRAHKQGWLYRNFYW
jgi:hypothetical protein